MANESEIIAIINSGMSFNRLLKPFLISAVILGGISFILGHFIIPASNSERINFENKYLKNKYYSTKKISICKYYLINIYIWKVSTLKREIGYKFTLENFNNGKLISKLKANYVQFDSITQKWQVNNNYEIREFLNTKKTLPKGKF